VGATGSGHKQGAAMVESCIVIALLCLILFGILQVSHVVASRNVLNYTAIATARSAAVGLNDFMLYKVSHYASIPVAGPIKTPDDFYAARPGGRTMGSKWDNAIARKNSAASDLGRYEVGIKEAYHLATPEMFKSILDYDNWQDEATDVRFSIEEDSKLDILHVTVEQNIPLVYPFSRVFFGHLDTVEVGRGEHMAEYPAKNISVTTTIEDHADLYLKGN
jgi:hypothetical protein